MGDLKLTVENDFQQKIMFQSFDGEFALATKADVLAWRKEWMGALSTWHSPYKLLVDCTNLKVTTSEEVKSELENMHKFFKGFFLRKAIGYGIEEESVRAIFPFDMVESEEEGLSAIGLRERLGAKPGDFRSQIQIQNHFRSHCIEVNFATPVVVESADQVSALKQKLTNNLMQWHSKWNLLFDCTNLSIDAAVDKDMELMFKFLRGFHLKAVIGYSPRTPGERYPFDVYRARHRAAAILESEGASSGDEADCKSRTPAQ